MTRGNQREIDRQRAANRAAKYAPKEKREGNVQSRNENDAKALAEKIARKKAEAEAKAAEDAARAAWASGAGAGGKS